jgi:HSP20 family protein
MKIIGEPKREFIEIKIKKIIIMTKQKKSFFEKLTGIKKVEEVEEKIEIQGQKRQGQNELAQYASEESYEFPENNNEIEDDEQEEINYEEKRSSKVNNLENPGASSDPMVDSEGQLTIDVYQTDDDIVIKSTIAGVKPEDLDVNINNDMVTIRGERKQDEEIDSENYYYQECYWGPFSRSVILPIEILTEKAEASMKNGILTLRLPKADAIKSRKIQVRSF